MILLKFLGLTLSALIAAFFLLSLASSKLITSTTPSDAECVIQSAAGGVCIINGQPVSVKVAYSERALGELAKARCTSTYSWGWASKPGADVQDKR